MSQFLNAALPLLFVIATVLAVDSIAASMRRAWWHRLRIRKELDRMAAQTRPVDRDRA